MRTFRILSITFLFLSIGFVANAQTEQGKILLGGQSKLNFSSLNTKFKMDNRSQEGGKTMNFEFSPQFGVFLVDGFVLGFEMPLAYSFEKNEANDRYTTNSFAVAPFIRYYFGTGNIKPYVHQQAGLGNLKTKFVPTKGARIEESAGLFVYEVGAGLGMFFNERVSLDVGMGYASVSLKPKENNDANIKSVSSGFALGIGVVVML